MKRYHFFLIITYCTFVSSCVSNVEGRLKGGNHKPFSDFPETQQLTVRPFLKYENNFARFVFINDTSIFLTNENGLTSDYLFYEYSLKDKKLLHKYVHGGYKKGMALSPLCCGLYRGNQLWLHDVSLNKLLTITVGGDSTTVQEFATSKFSYAVQLMKNKEALKAGIYHRTETMEITDLVADTTKKSFGVLPQVPRHIPYMSWKRAFEGFLFLKPDETKAALACRYSDRVELVDLKTGKSIIVKGPEGYDPVFLPIKDDNDYLIQRTEKTTFAYTNGACTNQYIYLLYSGNHEDNEHNVDGKVIFVFDWQGKPVKKIILDSYITGFAVSKDDKELFAFDESIRSIVQASLNF